MTDTPAVPTTHIHSVFSLKQCDQCWAMHESARLTRYCPACGSENHTVAIDNGEDARFIPPRTADDVLAEDYTYVDPKFVAAFREGWKAAEARSTPAEALDPSPKDARSIIRQLSNALMWCDTRYRQTLEGKPVRDVTELRHEIVSVLDASGRFLDARLSPESDR